MPRCCCVSDKKRAKAVAKISSGIEGFDDLTVGGLPRGRTTLLMGGPGSGKTVFALQVLVNGATRRGAPGIFVAFEENADL
jgi:circadian clock protein KaiC